MGTIDVPGIKEILWQRMRDDLCSYVPWFRDNDLLFCPCCLRPLPFEEFSLEHIVSQQAVATDAKSVREAISKNERSSLTLLCCRPLIYRGKTISGTGCNGWKGKHFDGLVRDIVTSDFVVKNRPISSGHQVALIAVGYLGLVRKYGFQIALSNSGNLLREQFFHPRNFIPRMPLQFQMFLAGEGLREYRDDLHDYWSEPLRITIEPTCASIVMRHVAFQLPLSHDPTKAVVSVLRYMPSKHRYRVDLRTVFD